MQRLASLPQEIKQQIADNTFKLRAPAGLENATLNLPNIKHSILELPSVLQNLHDKVIVIGAGPSLKRRDIVKRLKAVRDRVTLICCDGSLAACLREGLVPDVVSSLDPHAYRIVRWFGDPHLNERPVDDYFGRQDLDVTFRDNERVRNQETLDLVNKHGRQILAAFSTSAAPAVVERCNESGIKIFWWNPLYDDWDQPESYTRKVFEITKGIPCIPALGNVGSASWVLAHAVLGVQKVGVVGMDLGYPDGTSVVNTQYYDIVRHLPLEQSEMLMLRVENPHTRSIYLTDPVYYWYRESLLDAIRQAECVTVNCSEEGILFGEGVGWDTLENFAVS